MTSNKTLKPILIAAGGTGGHIYPALEVAKLLREKSVPVTWVGTQKGLEARVVPAQQIPIDWLSVSGVRQKGAASLAMAPLKIMRAMWQSYQILRRHQPRAVLGMGGFVSGPMCLMARILGVQVVIHEQNAVAGLTNQLLAKIADVTLCAYPLTLGGAELIGNPVRANILAIGKARTFAVKPKINMLVLGGSLGADALNQIVPETMALIEAKYRPQVWHQCGADKLASTQANYERAGIEAKISEFIEDMAAAYQWADLIICRAGAMTVSEVCAAALAAIFVPYPFAVDDHQTANASFLVKKQGAVLIQQNNLQAATLAMQLTGYSVNQLSLHKMAQVAHKMVIANSAEKICQALLKRAPRLNRKAEKHAAKAIAKLKQKGKK